MRQMTFTFVILAHGLMLIKCLPASYLRPTSSLVIYSSVASILLGFVATEPDYCQRTECKATDCMALCVIQEKE